MKTKKTKKGVNPFEAKTKKMSMAPKGKKGSMKKMSSSKTK